MQLCCQPAGRCDEHMHVLATSCRTISCHTYNTKLSQPPDINNDSSAEPGVIRMMIQCQKHINRNNSHELLLHTLLAACVGRQTPQTPHVPVIRQQPHSVALCHICVSDGCTCSRPGVPSSPAPSRPARAAGRGSLSATGLSLVALLAEGDDGVTC